MMLYTPVNLFLAMAELFLVLLSPLPNAYFIYLLVKRHDLHNNLRTLLGAFSSMLILIALTRLPTLINYITVGQLYVHWLDRLVFVHEVAVMFIRTIILPLTLERCLATWRSKTYEREEWPYFGIIATLVTLLLSVFLATFVSKQLNQSHLTDGLIHFESDAVYPLFQLIDVSVRFLLWLVCFSTFLALLYYNQRCYDFTRMPNKHHLAQRYQFSENVRANRQLLGVGTLIFVCNLYFDLIMLLILFKRNHFPVEYNLTFDLVLAVALNGVPALAIGLHPRMLGVLQAHWQAVKALIQSRTESNDGDAGWEALPPLTDPSSTIENRPKISNASSERRPSSERRLSLSAAARAQALLAQRSQPRALLSGTRLIIKREQQQSIHFDQLERSWTLKSAMTAKKERK